MRIWRTLPRNWRRSLGRGAGEDERIREGPKAMLHIR